MVVCDDQRQYWATEENRRAWRTMWASNTYTESLGCFMRKCRLSESLMGYLNDRNGVKIFARVVHDGNVRFYRSFYTKLTFRLAPKVSREPQNGYRPA